MMGSLSTARLWIKKESDASESYVDRALLINAAGAVRDELIERVDVSLTKKSCETVN